MINQFLKLFKKEYKTLNTVEISKNNLLQNYQYLLSLNKNLKIAPVLKSNAYGHGIIQVVQILDDLEAPFFCVDSLYEAYQLLKVSIKTPILIMGYTDPQNFKTKKLPFSYALFDLETAKVLNKHQPGCKVHIFVDTGMNREGIKLEDLPVFLKTMKQFNNITIEGLMSHFACADDKKDPLNKLQIKNFQKTIKIINTHGFNPKYIHLANSDGLLNFGNVLGFTNLARVGLALFGISNSHIVSGNIDLKPILTLKTKIIQIKKLNKGDQVGYEGIYVAKKDSIIGVLPIGYYDGLDRRLSNKGLIKVNGINCPIIGRVSMNLTTIDLTNVKNPKVGDEVFVYSDHRRDLNSIENASKICNTIPYDLLVHLAESTKRVVTRGE